MTRRESIRTGLTVLAICAVLLAIMVWGVRASARLPVLLQQMEGGYGNG